MKYIAFSTAVFLSPLLAQQSLTTEQMIEKMKTKPKISSTKLLMRGAKQTTTRTYETTSSVLTQRSLTALQTRGTENGVLKLGVKSQAGSGKTKIIVTTDSRREIEFKFAFANNKTNFVDINEAMVDLKKLSSVMKDDALQDCVFLIAGHASSPGEEDHNQNLSEKRAIVIKDYLKQLGVPEKQLIALGFGEKYLLTKANTEEAHAENRRVIVGPIERN